MSADAALELEVIDGTPKSNGYEQKAIAKKAEADPVNDEAEVVESDTTQVENEAPQNDENEFEGFDEGCEVQELSAYETEACNEEMPADFGIPNEDLINELLNEDINDDLGFDIDDSIDIDNI